MNIGKKTGRIIFLSLGLFFLGLGILGTVVPLLPTTPFILLATGCFARSSEYFHRKILDSRTFGPLVHDWHHHGAIRPKAKIFSSVMIIFFFSYALFFLHIPLGLKIPLGLLALGVLAFIWTRTGGEESGIGSSSYPKSR